MKYKMATIPLNVTTLGGCYVKYKISDIDKTKSKIRTKGVPSGKSKTPVDH